MNTGRHTPSYKGLVPASKQASAAAKASSAKRDTRPELVLRRVLWARGVRYRVDVRTLPGRPDVVLAGARVAVFCDGDFWHGRGGEQRLEKLRKGHNGPYWVAKIATNIERDRRDQATLTAAGWLVMRFWESDLRANPEAAAETILRVARTRMMIRRHQKESLAVLTILCQIP